MVRGTDRPAMTLAVDLGRKATKTKQKLVKLISMFNAFVVACNIYRVSRVHAYTS